MTSKEIQDALNALEPRNYNEATLKYIIQHLNQRLDLLESRLNQTDKNLNTLADDVSRTIGGPLPDKSDLVPPHVKHVGCMGPLEDSAK